MVLYNEQLEEEKGIMPFLGQLGQICTIHPEDVQKMREFLLGQTLGTVELKLLKKGHYKRILLDALQKEAMVQRLQSTQRVSSLQLVDTQQTLI